MSHATSHEALSDLIAPYALGILDAGEQRAVEEHLEACLSCRMELARYEDVVGGLGAMVTPVSPDPAVRKRVLAGMNASTPPHLAPPRWQVPPAWLAVAASIVLVSLVALGFLLAVTIEERDDARLSEQEIAEYLKDGGTLSALVPPPGAPEDVGAGHGSLAIVPDGSRAMLIVYDLPASDSEHRYVASAEREGEQVELGELRVNEQGVGWLLLYAPEPMTSYDTVRVTRLSPDAPDGEPFLVAPVG